VSDDALDRAGVPDEVRDFAALGLLDGVEGEARAARADLLARLHADGASLEELSAAVREERLALVGAERVLSGGRRLSAREVAREAGLDLDVFVAQRRASGLPLPGVDEPVLGETELAVARIVARFVDAGFPPDQLADAARVFGESAARAAATVRTLVGSSLSQPGDTELDLALRLADAARELNEPTAELLGLVYRLHLRDQLRGDVASAEAASAGRLYAGQEISVAFCDLVGFTRLGEGVDVEDLGAVANQLATLAAGVAQPPVRLVKTVGDAAMLVAPEPAPVLRASLALFDAAQAEGEAFPQLHAAVAHGAALQRYGDWYGPAVNLAARLVARARPSSVLATDAARQLAGDDGFAWSPAGRKRIKGVKEPVVVWRCRPAE
jgi:adenylate cyclase